MDITSAWETRSNALVFAGGKASLIFAPAPVTQAEVIAAQLPASSIIITPLGVQQVGVGGVVTGVSSSVAALHSLHISAAIPASGELLLEDEGTALQLTLTQSLAGISEVGGDLVLPKGRYSFQLTWVGGGSIYLYDAATDFLVAKTFEHETDDTPIIVSDSLTFELFGAKTLYMEINRHNSDELIVEAADIGKDCVMQGVITYAPT